MQPVGFADISSSVSGVQLDSSDVNIAAPPLSESRRERFSAAEELQSQTYYFFPSSLGSPAAAVRGFPSPAWCRGGCGIKSAELHPVPFLCRCTLRGKAAPSSLFQRGISAATREALIPGSAGRGGGLRVSFYLSRLLINNLRRTGLTIRVLCLRRRAFVLCRFPFSEQLWRSSGAYLRSPAVL